nr:enoyl-CoA hydratase/isomerase family protein [Pseudomonas aeruginosa]
MFNNNQKDCEMSTMTAPIRVDHEGPIDIVTLDRAETLNAVDLEMAQALHDYFSAMQSKRSTRVIILRSEGRAFSAGADLNSPAFVPPGSGRAQRQHDIQRLYSGIVRLMRSCPQPIIALAQGAACGAGFSLLLASDVRYVTCHVKMNAAYLKVGLGGCDMGSGYLLSRLVGMSVAAEYLLSGRFITAERARAMGLVSEIVEPEQLLETGLALAADMLKASPMGLRMTKETLNAVIDAGSLDAGLALEDRQQVILLDTDDHREAVQAFRERREPRYRDS